MDSIRIAIVDDHPIFRDGVAAMLRSRSDFELVGEGASADDAVRMASAKDAPDVMLLDVSMPGGGLAALRRITGAAKAPRVVMLTVSESGEDVVAAFSEGATGYLLKGVHKSELFDALKKAHAGATVIDPNLAVRVIVLLSQQGNQRLTANAEQVDGLSAREREILAFVEQGLSNKEIARRLGLNPRTIKNNMTRIMAKLQVRNRVEAAIRRRMQDVRK